MLWLSPLLVMIDYLEFYQDDTEEKMNKHLTLVEELMLVKCGIKLKQKVKVLKVKSTILTFKILHFI